jgi:hypothetical protein
MVAPVRAAAVSILSCCSLAQRAEIRPLSNVSSDILASSYLLGQQTMVGLYRKVSGGAKLGPSILFRWLEASMAVQQEIAQAWHEARQRI